MLALKHLGVTKDWEKTHIDSVIMLVDSINGTRVSLKNNITAIKEYDTITFYKNLKNTDIVIPFSLGEIAFDDKKLFITKIDKVADIENGLFADKDKIPNDAVIRTRRDGDRDRNRKYRHLRYA